MYLASKATAWQYDTSMGVDSLLNNYKNNLKHKAESHHYLVSCFPMMQVCNEAEREDNESAVIIDS